MLRDAALVPPVTSHFGWHRLLVLGAATCSRGPPTARLMGPHSGAPLCIVAQSS